jgi:hypothetical protein
MRQEDGLWEGLRPTSPLFRTLIVKLQDDLLSVLTNL